MGTGKIVKSSSEGSRSFSPFEFKQHFKMVSLIKELCKYQPP